MVFEVERMGVERVWCLGMKGVEVRSCGWVGVVEC